MQAPVVTLKVTPRELKMMDIALELLSIAGIYAHQAKTDRADTGMFGDCVKTLLCNEAENLDGDCRRLTVMANKMRETISLF